MSTDNILVAIRARPLIQREQSEKLRKQWIINNKTIYQVDDDNHRMTDPYSFDYIFQENQTNGNIYSSVVKPLVDSCLHGFNSTIFAYGQTSSGKTHTMMGNDNVPGIIHLAASNLFEHMRVNRIRRYLISCSYFEIYNEKINDLLDKNNVDLKIHIDYGGNTFISAKEEVVTETSQVFNLIKLGNKMRKVGCTNMNERSSRSHTILRLTIESTDNTVENGPVQISNLNLVDLAGSERIAHTKAAGIHLKEGVNINKSLSVLANVIRQLSENEGFVNYRDSKLTRLLQHALGGNAKSLIIANITLATGEETKSTLEFAQRAKVIKNKPIINKILTEQDKLKQYELLTAGYKDRINEMEKEKVKQEEEISRLKRHVRLIDMFKNGPPVKQEHKVSRRHTMSYSGSRNTLETIPESEDFFPTPKINLKEKEKVTNLELDISDEQFMKKMVEESLEDILETPQRQIPHQIEDDTPASLLRNRLKSLEESYLSLQEFTRLEAEFKADEIEEKKKHQEELNFLKQEVDKYKKKCDELTTAFSEIKQENDSLRLIKAQEARDSAVLIDQQKLMYENRIDYLIREIDIQNTQQEHRQEILSKLNLLQDILSEPKVQGDLIKTVDKSEENNVKLQKEIDAYKEKLNLKISENENFIQQLQQLEVDVESKDKTISEMKHDMETYSEKIETAEKARDDLFNKLRSIEEKEREMYNEQLEIKDAIISDFKKEIKTLTEKDKVSEEKIQNLLQILSSAEEREQKHNLEMNKKSKIINEVKKEIGAYKEQLNLKISENENFIRQLQQLEVDVELKDKTISEMKHDLEMYSDKIETAENARDDLFNKLRSFKEKEKETYNEQLEIKDAIISDIKKEIKTLTERDKISEEKIQDLLQILSSAGEREQKNNLEMNKKSEIINEMKKEIDAYKEQLNLKISENENFIRQLQKFEVDVELKDQAISEMKHDMKTYSERIETAEKTRDDLFNKLRSIEEKEKETYNEQLEIKDAIISDIKKEIKMNEMKKEIDAYKEQLNLKINENENFLRQLQKLEVDVELKDKAISEMKHDKETYLEKIETAEKTRNELFAIISDIKKKAKTLTEEDEAFEENIENLLQMLCSGRKREQKHKLEMDKKTEIINEMKKEIDSYKEQLNLKISENENFLRRLQKLEVDVELKDKAISEMEHDMETYSEKIETAEKTRNDLINKLRSIEEQERKETKICHEQLEIKDGIISDIKKEMKTLTEKVELSEKKIQDLLQKLNSAGEREQEHELEMDNKNEIINKMKKEIEKIAIIDKMKEDLEILAAKEILYKKQLAEKDGNINELKQNIDGFIKTATVLKEEKMELLEKLWQAEALENETKAKNSTILDLEKQINILLEKVVVLETEKEDLIINGMNAVQKSCPSSPRMELSPLDIRRRKRQSIHDQRRGLQECSDFLVNEDTVLTAELNETIKKQTLEISSLKSQINELCVENQNLQTKVEDLTSELTRVTPKQTNQTQTDKVMECANCTILEAEIKMLKDSQWKDQFKIVDLQTKLYDFENAQKYERNCQQDTQRRLDYKIAMLQQELTQFKSKELVSVCIQCNKEDLEPKPLPDSGVQTCKENEELKVKLKQQDEEIKLMKEKIEYLSGENHVLEMEVRHFMDEYEQAKSQLKACTNCNILENDVKQSEEKLKKYQEKVISLQKELNFYDQNKEVQKLFQQEKEKRMAEKFAALENKLCASKNTSTISIQCNLNHNGNAEANSDTIIKRTPDHKLIQDKGLLETVKEEKSTVQKLNKQIDELSGNNHVLNMEIKHYIDEVSKCKTRIKELESRTIADSSQPCTNCTILAELQKKNQFKIVNLQTKIYDMKNSQEFFRNNYEDKERCMAHRIAELETKFAQSLAKKTAIGVQCELVSYNELLQKNMLLKQLARMRRNEGNILRSRLGMEPDEPVE